MKTLGEELDEIFAAAPVAPETVSPDPIVIVSPGTCSIHGLELVTHRRAGFRWWGEDPETVCPDPEHTDADRERCRWCGGQLVPAGTPHWQVSSRRAYCLPLHRLQAFRARARAGQS